ncbi:hypothetical protein GCM10007298_21040 [Williamsia phyllosphaerae]|uniref:Excalibur calcium-binding domain-containing protein n=2 Tax=Williamsia phyllosphaerae TaxID=885042 RepID=A0ABQ1USL2_9NOCA|nr:hypothetical protein GCM10007298_21040 [Williamsia phyllosphaerae]
MNLNPLSRAVIAVGSACLLTLGAMATAAPASAATYSNCSQLNQDYPHGVGQTGAVDSTSGTPVTNFERDDAVYQDNTKRDRDKDGIACEKK